MAFEIELKLALPVRSAPRLRQFVSLLGLPSRRQWMSNVYLDTPNLLLLQEKVAVRQRQITTTAEKVCLLTVKTEGVTLNGVSRRAEWEFSRQTDLLNFSGVDDIVLRNRLASLSSELKPVFRVDFVRQIWNLPGNEIGMEGSNIELALDFGYIRAESENPKRKAFCEVELELIEGNEAALAIWGERICLLLPELRHQTISKAARGYALLINCQP